MSSKRNRDHEFLEVDEDLRRIAEREAANPVCPFGQRCYRKNPNHFKEFRHRPEAAQTSKDQKQKTKPKEPKEFNKRNKITHFFARKPTPQKTKIEIPDNKESDYEIEDSEEDEEVNKSVMKAIKESYKPSEPTPPKRSKPSLKEDINEEKESVINPKMTPNQMNQVFKEIFLVEMPKDFFDLWQFCKNIKPTKPEDALVDTLGLRLVGPYDLLSGRMKKESLKDKQRILCHWRYYYDLPEMQTIVSSVKSGYHLAYFRDTPEEDNPVIVSNSGDNSCAIEGIADNIFAAIYCEIQKMKSKVTANNDLKTIESKLKEFCKQNKIDFMDKTKLKERKTKINAKTFNGFGIVVPYNKKTEVGYRPLPLNDSELKKLLNTIIKTDPEIREDSNCVTDLKEIYQLISYANDECDFGMGLELGIDLFSSGDPFFHKSIVYLLSLAYNLLKRDVFTQIISAHMSNRRKGFHLDLL